MSPKNKLSSVAAVSLLLIAGLSWAEKKAPSDPLLRVRDEMLVISRQLGVTCTHCHDMNNLKSSKKDAYKTAKDHMRITELLNKQGFKGRPKVDCYLCHRGQLKPIFKEPIAKESEH